MATPMKLKIATFLTGVFSALCAVPKKEGFLGLYKGNGAMMVRIFPYGAIQFTAFDRYRKVKLVDSIVVILSQVVLSLFPHVESSSVPPHPP